MTIITGVPRWPSNVVFCSFDAGRPPPTGRQRTLASWREQRQPDERRSNYYRLLAGVLYFRSDRFDFCRPCIQFVGRSFVPKRRRRNRWNRRGERVRPVARIRRYSRRRPFSYAPIAFFPFSKSREASLVSPVPRSFGLRRSSCPANVYYF